LEFCRGQVVVNKGIQMSRFHNVEIFIDGVLGRGREIQVTCW
jgi:hypothetical protein